LGAAGWRVALVDLGGRVSFCNDTSQVSSAIEPVALRCCSCPG
jgi:hypothetical protein